MELALIIAIVALIVALPGCIADSLTIIAKIRALKKEDLLRPTLSYQITHPDTDHFDSKAFLKTLIS